MKLTDWLRFFREHPEKPLFKVADLAQLTDLHPGGLATQLKRLVQDGVLQRPVRGWYINPFRTPTNEEIAMVLRSPSYLSLEYALSAASILSQWSFRLTLVTTGTPYLFTKEHPRFEYHHLGRTLFYGYRMRDGVAWADPEKALLDLIYLRHLKTGKLDEDRLRSLLGDMYLEDLDQKLLQEYAEPFAPYARRLLALLADFHPGIRPPG